MTSTGNDVARTGGDADFSLMPELFREQARGHVRALGRFVRLAEGIVDSTHLSRADKLARLEVLEASLDGRIEVVWSPRAASVSKAFRASLNETGISAEHARRILRAFRGDAAGVTHRTWDDLMRYCDEAAAPIGRHMLELFGEDIDACAPASDAGCAALHILKQLRDCRDPRLTFNRLCIPVQFMEDAMVSMDHLRAPTAKGQTRAVIDRVLDGVDTLLARAAPLPRILRTRGLRLHTAIVLCRCGKFQQRFREVDPLQQRVALGILERQSCAWGIRLKALVGLA